MQVLQVTAYESPGRRFNGLSLSPLLMQRGINSTHLVWHKDTNDSSILTFPKNLKRFNRLAEKTEHLFSVQSMLYINSFYLTSSSAFKNADLLHLHIIHSGFLSLWALPEITKMKPTVWTLHDPWAITGHCIYPFDCARWKVGCGECPNLKTQFPIRSDRTDLLFKYKRHQYSKSKFEIVVASQWMMNMVKASPLFEGVHAHHVPFGLDLNFFLPMSVSNARNRFNIPENALVLCFRSDISEFKGLPYILKVLDKIRCEQPISLLTFATKGLLENIANHFQLVELGWTNDEELFRDALVAADIFLMPSAAEAFGVMAIEAMACGKPVISFEGTSLPEITFAPEVGVSVPMGDTQALINATQYLIDNPEARLERGRKGRLIAEKYYNAETQADRISEIYRMMATK